MSITNGSIMKSQEVKDLFIANVTNRIMDGVTDADTFKSKVNIGTTGNDHPTNHEINMNIRSLPQEDTVSIATKTNEINNLPIPTSGNYISGKTLYKALVSTMSKMSTVRTYTTKWYHQEESEFKLMEEKSGKAAFKDHLALLTSPEKTTETRIMEKIPGHFENGWVPPTYETYNVDVYFKSVLGDGNKINGGWERNTDIGSQNLSVPANPFTEGAIIKSNQIIELLNKIYDAWKSASNNKIEYKYYSCHSNCHSSCHSNRGRR